MMPVSERCRPKRIVVICEDGAQRHEEPFAWLVEALEWANWGHVCMSSHELREVAA